jgi:hypothetical protein
VRRQTMLRSTTKEGIVGRLGKVLENPLARERLEFLQTVRDTDESAASETPRTSNDRVRKLALGAALVSLGSRQPNRERSS